MNESYHCILCKETRPNRFDTSSKQRCKECLKKRQLDFRFIIRFNRLSRSDEIASNGTAPSKMTKSQRALSSEPMAHPEQHDVSPLPPRPASARTVMDEPQVPSVSEQSIIPVPVVPVEQPPNSLEELSLNEKIEILAGYVEDSERQSIIERIKQEETMYRMSITFEEQIEYQSIINSAGQGILSIVSMLTNKTLNELVNHVYGRGSKRAVH